MTLEALYPEARWRGPIVNKTPGAMSEPLLGLVLHVEQGSEAGTDAWFHNPGAEASAHLGAPKQDALGDPVPLDQFVAFDDRAWAEVSGNSRWLSIETAGYNSTALDSNQLHKIASLYADLHNAAGFPFRTSESPTEAGFGWHGMGGEAWGGHLDCPGDLRKAQRAIILAKAITLVHPTPVATPKPSPHETTPAYPGKPLSVGSSGGAVKELTEQLHARGWSIEPTTSYTSAVEKVVAEFEAQKDLRVDGIAGPVVWWSAWHLPVTP